MARPVHGHGVVVLPLILAGFLLLLQVSESSRSSSPSVVHAAAPRRELLDADHGRTPPSAGTPWSAEGAVGSSRPHALQTMVRAGPRPAALLRSNSKLARRFLAEADVDEAGTDRAGASCHSNSVHISCPPASKP